MIVNSITIGPNVFINSEKRPTVNSAELHNLPWVNNSMVNAFFNCINLSSVTNINENITNMYNTFAYCNKMVDAPIIPNSIIDMRNTFYHCDSLINAPDLSNCANLTDMGYTFSGCANLVNVPVIPNSVNTMYATFANCRNLVNAPNISSNVIEMSAAFINCHSLTGDIYIYSENINGINGSSYDQEIFYNTSLDKDVYIPFKNNGVYTRTYNTFVNGGYSSTSRLKNGVKLCDINHEEVFTEDFDYTMDENNDVILTRYKGAENDVDFPTIE